MQVEIRQLCAEVRSSQAKVRKGARVLDKRVGKISIMFISFATLSVLSRFFSDHFVVHKE